MPCFPRAAGGSQSLSWGLGPGAPSLEKPCVCKAATHRARRDGSEPLPCPNPLTRSAQTLGAGTASVRHNWGSRGAWLHHRGCGALGVQDVSCPLCRLLPTSSPHHPLQPLLRLALDRSSQALSCFTFVFGGHRMASATGVNISLPPGRLGSDKSPAGQALVRSLV